MTSSFSSRTVITKHASERAIILKSISIIISFGKLIEFWWFNWSFRWCLCHIDLLPNVGVNRLCGLFSPNIVHYKIHVLSHRNFCWAYFRDIFGIWFAFWIRFCLLVFYFVCWSRLIIYFICILDIVEIGRSV